MDQEYLDYLIEAIDTANTQMILDYIIMIAITAEVSDIHIEPYEKYVRIRFRIDGVLKVIETYPAMQHMAVVSRLKITSRLKIDEKRIPQDGRTPFRARDHYDKEFTADLRVSTLPTVHGEKLVMRIGQQSNDIPPYDKLGLQGNNFNFITELIKKPNGVIVVSGPTGSGKTVTLYSTLKELNQEGINIMTIENPVELEMDGLSQCETNHEVGLDFSVGLRAALRQDPDIIMIGEIRDEETAEVAMHAALTGHLVLSTIHTNSAAETINRFENMEIPKYIIASALKGVIAQRLVRRICKYCKVECEIEPHVRQDIERTIQRVHHSEVLVKDLLKTGRTYKGTGCEKCAMSGYKGRLGIYEVLSVGEPIVQGILEGKSILQLQEIAMNNGMTTLKQDGIIKALMGMTTVDEIYRVANDK